jgi:hypothetical protein
LAFFDVDFYLARFFFSRDGFERTDGVTHAASAAAVISNHNSVLANSTHHASLQWILPSIINHLDESEVRRALNPQLEYHPLIVGVFFNQLGLYKVF